MKEKQLSNLGSLHIDLCYSKNNKKVKRKEFNINYLALGLRPESFFKSLCSEIECLILFSENLHKKEIKEILISERILAILKFHNVVTYNYYKHCFVFGNSFYNSVIMNKYAVNCVYKLKEEIFLKM
jgi:hypothetical protein